MQNRLWNTIDRWGPGAIAIVTLLAVLIMGHQYSVQIAATRAKVDSIEKEILILSNTDNRTDRVEVENLQRQLTDFKREFGDKLEVEIMTSAKTRERLVKKGWIEP